MVDYILAHLPLIITAVLGIPALIFLATRFIKNIGSVEIAITERRYHGKELEPGRAFAMNGQVGIQAKYLAPGLKLLCWPFITIKKREKFLTIGSEELGIVEATDGEPLPAGRIFAEDGAGDSHDNFQDPVAFLTNKGIRGVQLRFITNGQYKMHPDLFKVIKIAKTKIPDGKIGVVYAADGASLKLGELVGRSVAGHENFQKAEVFLKNGGQKGPQVDILRPGTYNIHTGIFKVEIRDAISVEDGQVGCVEALGGEPMHHGDVVAETPNGHRNFQDGEAFLAGNGIRGPQTALLAPGRYYINPYLFSVTAKHQTVVKQGEVAVLIANHGKDPSVDEVQTDSNGPVEGGATDPVESRLNEGNRQRHVVPAGYRGIQKDTLGPGRYNLNPLVHQIVIGPTTTRSLHWAGGDGGEKGATSFDPFEVVSHDGFSMKVEVRCQYRILPENMPYVIAKLGSIAELENNVIHPQIDGIFRAEVSKSPAIKFQQERAGEQKKAEDEVRRDLAKYKVEVVSVMITNIHLPEQLMHTTQEKNLAEQRQSMFAAQQLSEQSRIQFEQTKAQADQQIEIIRAETGIKVAEHKAQQKIKEAEGEAQRIELTANANAKKTRVEGEATAAAQRAIGEAQGVAYQKQVEAMGQNGVTLVEVIKAVSASGLRITPDIIAGGGEGGNGGLGSVITALLAKQLNAPAQAPNPTAAPTATSTEEAPAA
jgi:uncharacterized membrane protein YqiK